MPEFGKEAKNILSRVGIKVSDKLDALDPKDVIRYGCGAQVTDVIGFGIASMYYAAHGQQFLAAAFLNASYCLMISAAVTGGVFAVWLDVRRPCGCGACAISKDPQP